MGKQKKQYKLILFDMDGTLLNGWTIFTFAEKKGFTNQLTAILSTTKEPYEKSIEIAQLLKGIQYQELLDIFKKIPLQEHVQTLIPLLREKQIKTALVTDGYQRFANDLKKRLGIDYAFANRLSVSNQLVTGDLLFQNKALQRSNDGKIYSINKRSVFDFLCMILDISPSEVIAIGDGYVDIDMIEAAGLGIAYKAPPKVQSHADIATDDLRVIMKYIEE
ncbi:MAG TPA: HAD-IB family phosphatase [Candidatus Thermoplasmatota archaeon]|nr:HAD-IB family phosphatase [Candidatus Thermoplasmatota archaeon]